MRNAGYTEDLPDVVVMGMAPLRAFGRVLEAARDDETTTHLYEVGVVTSALVDYAERRLVDALAVVEAKVGRISLGFDGKDSSIADNVVGAEMRPAIVESQEASHV